MSDQPATGGPAAPPPTTPGGNGGANGGSGSINRRSRIPSDLRLQVAIPADTAGVGNAAGGGGGGGGFSVGVAEDVDDNRGAGDGFTPAGTIASRPAYTEVQLEQAYQTRMEPEEQKAHKQNLMDERRANKEVKGKGVIALGIITRLFPFVKVLLNYDLREYGPYDLLSGISVGLFLIPQSIAYALLANLRPQSGFYSAFFAMIIYFIFGTSNHLNMTNQGAISLLVGEAVRAGVDQVYPNRVGLCLTPNSTADSNYTAWSTSEPTVAWTSATTFTSANTTAATNVPCTTPDDANARIALTITMIAGALQLVLGLFQFGFLTIYLSDPINSAFTCGAALHIVSSQLGNMLGAPIPTINGNGKFFLYFIEAVKEILASKVNVPTILVFVFFFLILLSIKIVNERCIKHIRVPIPIDIIVLIASLLLSKFLFWETTLKIASVGEIRKGFEAPRSPKIEHFTSGSGIIVNGIVLGVISYALSVSLSKTFALRNGYEIDPNQEMIAYGAVNIGMCWFSTFVSAAAITCTSLHESLKGKTLVYSLYAAVITLIAILVIAPEFAPVPKCVLSAIIIVNLKNMILQVEQLPRLWRTNRYDFTIFLVTLGAILGLDLPIGLLIGVVFSLATVIFRTQAPKAYLLGRLPNTDIYRNIKKHKKAEQIPGIKIFKFEGSLYFASAENYRNRLYRQVALNPKRILAKAKARAKREGRRHGEVDLRTDMLQVEGVRQILETVTEEGSHPVAEARVVAQGTQPVLEKHAHFESVAYHSDKEIASTVNIFCIILDLSACAFTDAVGIRLLSQIVDEFSKIGVEIYLSGCTWLVRSQLRKANFYAKRSEEGLFVTVHDAVLHALSTFYNELVQDEAKMHDGEEDSQLDAAGNAGGSAGDGATSDNAAAAGPSHGGHGSHSTLAKSRRMSSTELARDRRRRIRKESWRRNSSELLAGNILQTRSLQPVSSLPALAEGVIVTDMSHPISGTDSEASNGHVRFGLPQDLSSGASLSPHNGPTGLDNAGFEGETKF